MIMAFAGLHFKIRENLENTLGPPSYVTKCKECLFFAILDLHFLFILSFLLFILFPFSFICLPSSNNSSGLKLKLESKDY